MTDAVKKFRTTFRKVVRVISKQNINRNASALRNDFRKAMIEAHVPSTSGRIAMVNTWINRACKLGGAV